MLSIRKLSAADYSLQTLTAESDRTGHAATQLAIDAKGCLIVANNQACALFGIKNSDLGALVQNLELGGKIPDFAKVVGNLKQLQFFCKASDFQL